MSNKAISEDPQCGSCRFWCRNEKGDFGQCLYYPPAVVADEEGEHYTAWPEPHHSRWCSKFERGS